jgi:hypothetical protein
VKLSIACIPHAKFIGAEDYGQNVMSESMLKVTNNDYIGTST